MQPLLVENGAYVGHIGSPFLFSVKSDSVCEAERRILSIPAV